MAVIVPTLRWERPLWRGGATRIAGVDEVGVAPTCGAVVAAAVIMSPELPPDPGRPRLQDPVRRPARAPGADHPSPGGRDRRRGRVGRRHRPAEHLPRDPPRDAPRDRPARRPRPRARRRAADRRLRGAGRAVHGDRRRRRPGLLDRLRVGHREDRPRPDDAQPRASATRSTAGTATPATPPASTATPSAPTGSRRTTARAGRRSRCCWPATSWACSTPTTRPTTPRRRRRPRRARARGRRPMVAVPMGDGETAEDDEPVGAVIGAT